MQIIDLPDSARITTVSKADGTSTPDDSYMLVPASVWDELLHGHTTWQHVITPDAERAASA